MERKYIAHINESTGKIQTVKEHCENTAKLCEEYAVRQFKILTYIIGMSHDIGKYQDAFQKRISGSNIRVEHSTCGALVAKENYPFYMALMMEYCIAGHHSGIPDGGTEWKSGTSDNPTLSGRMNQTFEDFSAYKEELVFPEINFQEWVQFLACDCGNDMGRLIDKFAFLTRYCFSCLVDADSKDTADFCRAQGILPPRKMKANFGACLKKVNAVLSGFQCETDLQLTRTKLQKQAFRNASLMKHQNGEIFLLNMPTGSGKTITSVKLALEMAIASDEGKAKRIIYVIPYNSIIEQTAETFEKMFGDDLEILRHQSTFSFEDKENQNEDYREAAKCAVENWDAPFIITTAVQFFESVYANKRGKLRKMHNMANSILIFDEAHLMPVDYLQPCLQSIAYITRYLNSKAIFLTATMPDFQELVREYALPDSRIANLIEDQSLFSVFRKCRFTYLGEMECCDLIEKMRESPSSLIIVNKRASARKLYRECSGKKYHLSTYMTSFDRKKKLKEIREELKKLEEDFPGLENVPQERRVTIISTSLIEAGVDLDVYTVFRETAGLDSILQAGGRCNREGKRAMAEVYMFDFADTDLRAKTDVKGSLTKGLLKKYTDISAPECIREYYVRLYFMNKDEIQKNAMHTRCDALESIPFKTYAEDFELIDTRTVSLMVERDEKSRKLVEAMRFGSRVSVRELQNYTCTLYQRELDDLIHQHVADDFGTGVYCLINPDYYDEELGVLFEAKDYIL